MRTVFGVSAAILAFSAASALAAPAMQADSSMGKIWVDSKGMALYTFDKDTKGTSACYDKCAVAWPPLMAEKGAKAEGGWTLVKRKDGKMQWAYDGHPLYTFVKDKKAGDVMGDGVNKVWHVAKGG
jgi:predicted lipoprotein with Yx(FWY)xxD motif